MPTQVTRYISGDTTVTLTGDLEGFVRRALAAASTTAATEIGRAANEVAANAEREWYGPSGVTRRTGKSGDIAVVTTVGDDRVKVAVGSTDLAKAKFVHRPGRLATSPEEITSDEYAAAKRKGGPLASLVWHARRGDPARGIVLGRYYRSVPSAGASDGRYLLPLLVSSPMRARARAVAEQIGREMAGKFKGGGRG